MKLFTSLFAILALSLSTLAQEKAFVKNELLVQLYPKTNLGDFERSVEQSGLNLNTTQLLSKNMNIYLLQWEDNTIDNYKAINLISGVKGVLNIQNNHLIETRETIPTDPSFGQTWHHKNTGQTGGTNDDDIDTPDAWDITTGGTTATGDDIVVCILEPGGANLNHPDISTNIYANPNEIPNNNIDDDNNGYIDDINGWNVSQSADNHNTGNHGTQVMGMIGASANDIGSVGVNHQVGMMLVSGFGLSESGVIAAYDYPLTQRKLYNSSGGTNGAFVVATNASWGIDGANPANYPLWCAYYDTLGVHGILNCGATTNNNFNVDSGGDMPTACASDYMVSVTATNHNDLRTFSGYGATTIDLAAPGENVLLPTGSNSYGTTSGTSFASPCVAGAIALAYSTPCSSLMTLVNADPQAGADYIRTALMNTVDPVTSLANECVTGGRMNVYSFIQQLVNGCSGSNCLAPYTVNLTDLQSTSASFDLGTFTTDNYIYYQTIGSSIWDSTLFTGSTVTLNNLNLCNTYRIRFSGVCTNDISAYSDTLIITTEGCCEFPSTEFVSSTNTDLTLEWDDVLIATEYDLEYAPVGTTNWTVENNVSSPYTLSGLDDCTLYSVRMTSLCADSSSSYSPITEVETMGCGSCQEVDYCAVDNGDTQYEWIQSITIDNLTLSTGNDDGYRPTENSQKAFQVGDTYTIGMQPGYSGGAFSDDMMVWIDYNQNGDFETNELVLDLSGNSAVQTNVTIPTNAILGRTRIRFMLYGSSGTPSACLNNFYWGETEDYCITLFDYLGINDNEDLNNIVISPNPATEVFSLNGNIKNTQVSIYNLQGRVIKSIQNYNEGQTVSISELPKGAYLVEVGNSTTRLKLIKQ